MANFAVSIITGGQYDITVNTSGVATIVDHSNYNDNTESGHFFVNFSDYRKLHITNPSGTVYTFSSLGDGDAFVLAPVDDTVPSTDIVYTSTGDGVYNLLLIALPTWSNSANYKTAAFHHVYYSGKIYKCILNGTNKQPDTQTTYWEEVDEEDLPVKYRLSQNFVVYASLYTCFQQASYAAVDALVSAVCGECLCGNSYVTSARDLGLIIYHIPVLIDNSDWDRLTSVINKGLQICSCLSSSSTNCNCH